MTENLTITGNGTTFHDETDLTDKTRSTILAAFVIEITRTDIRMPGHELSEGLKASLRAIRRVEALATDAGWTPRCTAPLGVVAGDIYGRVLADAAQTMGSR